MPKFSRQVVLGLLSTSIVAQILPLLIQPLLARLYNQDGFSVWAQAISLGTLATPLMVLQIQNLVAIERSRIRRQLWGAAANAGLVTVISICVVSICTFWLAGYLTSSTTAVVWLTLSYAASASLALSIRGQIGANQNFELLGRHTLVRSSVLSISQIILGILSIKNGLVFGMIAGEIAGIAYAAYVAGPSSVFGLMSGWFRRGWFVIFRNLPRIVLFVMQEFVAIAAFYLPLYFSVGLFASNDGANFAVAHRAVWAIPVLASSALGLYFQNHMFTGGDVPMFRQKTYGAIYIAVFIIIGVVVEFVASDVFAFVFGANWIIGGEIFCSLSMWAIAFCCAFPFRLYLRSRGLQGLQLAVDIIALAIGILWSLVFGFVDIVHYAYVVSIIGVAQNAAIVILCWRKIHSDDSP